MKKRIFVSAALAILLTVSGNVPAVDTDAYTLCTEEQFAYSAGPADAVSKEEPAAAVTQTADFSAPAPGYAAAAPEKQERNVFKAEPTYKAADSSGDVLTPEEYGALTAAEKSNFVPLVNYSDIRVFDLDGNAVENGDYIKKGTEVQFSLEVTDYNSYFNYEMLVNGQSASLYYYGDGLYYGWITVESDFTNFNIVFKKITDVIVPEDYNKLSQAEKANYVPLSLESPAYVIVNRADSEIITFDGDIICADDGDYIKKGSWAYIAAYVSEYSGNIFLNGTKWNVELSADGVNRGNAYQIKDTDTKLDITLELTGKTVITSGEYARLTAAQKANYVPASVESPAYMHIYESMRIYTGDYVKKGTEIYICTLTTEYADDIFLNGEKLDIGLSGDDGNRGTRYVVKADDTKLEVTLVKYPGKHVVNAEEYAKLSAEAKSKYVPVNISGNAYMLCGDINDSGGYCYFAENGDYVKKGVMTWIAAYAADYIGHDICLNGTKLAVNCYNYPYTNFGVARAVRDDDTALNITMTERPLDETDKNMVGVYLNTNAGIGAVIYIDANNNGNYLFSGCAVEKGEVIRLFAEDKNFMAGYDFTVNGKTVECFDNSDGSGFISAPYTVQEDMIYIDRAKRDQLTDFEKENFVPVNFGGNIHVWEFLDEYEDEYIWFNSGSIIEKGTKLRLWVEPQYLAGKEVVVNGSVAEMWLNGDGSAFIGDYEITAEDTSVEITLRDKPVEKKDEIVLQSMLAIGIQTDDTGNIIGSEMDLNKDGSIDNWDLAAIRKLN